MAKRSKYYALETSGKSAEITIYGDITSWPWLESDVSAYDLSKQIADLDVEEIAVNINSYGGEVAEGLAIYNALKRHKAKITTRCDGFACSVASVIFSAGDTRVMNDASLLMIHNAWTRAEGNASELRKQADDLDKINDASVKAYMAIAKVDESEIRALMDNETWISPDEAVKLGLATAVEKDKSDKPSQSARRKVMQMILNPYQMDDPDDPEKDPDEPETDPDGPEKDPDGTDDGQEPGTDGTDTGDTDPDTGGDQEPGTGDDGTDGTDPDDTEDDPEKDPDDPNQVCGPGKKKKQETGDDDPDAEAQQMAFLRAIMTM